MKAKIKEGYYKRKDFLTDLSLITSSFFRSLAFPSSFQWWFLRNLETEKSDRILGEVVSG
jgi:hypothetical protein